MRDARGSRQGKPIKWMVVEFTSKCVRAITFLVCRITPLIAEGRGVDTHLVSAETHQTAPPLASTV